MRRALSGPETVCQPLPTLASSANCFSHRTEKPQILRALEELNRNKFNWATLKLCTKSLGVPITSNAGCHDANMASPTFLVWHMTYAFPSFSVLKMGCWDSDQGNALPESECHKSSYKRRCRHLHFNLIIVLQDSAAHIACKALFLGSGLRTFWLFLSIFPFETFLDTLFVPLELLTFLLEAGDSWYKPHKLCTCRPEYTVTLQSVESQNIQKMKHITFFIFLHNVALSASKICACTIVDCRSCTTSNHWYLSQSWFRTKTLQHACASINLTRIQTRGNKWRKTKSRVNCWLWLWEFWSHEKWKGARHAMLPDPKQTRYSGASI